MQGGKAPDAAWVERTLTDVITSLGGTPGDAMKQLAGGIAAAMSGPNRCFHDLRHLEDVSNSAPSVEVLSILFHDLVQTHVDGDIPRVYRSRLADAVIDGGSGLIWKKPDTHHAREHRLCGQLFDLDRDANGANEAWSALLAFRLLDGHLPRSVQAHVACCIEATIPFRQPSNGDDGPAERLHQRLTAADEEFELGLGEQGCLEAVHASVGVANRDVANFSGGTISFLENTHRLLHESRFSQGQAREPRCGEQRRALDRMEGFLSHLDAGLVFRSFRGVPSDAEMSSLQEAARQNLELGSRCLRAEMLAAAILEALTLRSGGDMAVEQVTGSNERDRLAGSLKAAGLPTHEVDEQFLEILESPPPADRPEPGLIPVATWLLRVLGEEETERLLGRYRSTLESLDCGLLDALPDTIRQTLIEAATLVLPQRREELLALS